MEPATGLRLQPWRLSMLFSPVERILERLEAGEAFDANDEGEICCSAQSWEQAFPWI